MVFASYSAFRRCVSQARAKCAAPELGALAGFRYVFSQLLYGACIGLDAIPHAVTIVMAGAFEHHDHCHDLHRPLAYLGKKNLAISGGLVSASMAPRGRSNLEVADLALFGVVNEATAQTLAPAVTQAFPGFLQFLFDL